MLRCTSKSQILNPMLVSNQSTLAVPHPAGCMFRFGGVDFRATHHSPLAVPPNSGVFEQVHGNAVVKQPLGDIAVLISELLPPLVDEIYIGCDNVPRREREKVGHCRRVKCGDVSTMMRHTREHAMRHARQHTRIPFSVSNAEALLRLSSTVTSQPFRASIIPAAIPTGLTR
jgi:hypothetical protein